MIDNIEARQKSPHHLTTDFTSHRKEAIIMFSPDPIRSRRTVSQSKPVLSFNDIALAMFPSMVDQLLAPQFAPVVLPETPTAPLRDRHTRSIPRR